ncbi:hypothetical protein CJI59_04255 [Streptomyces sp. Alain-F2R5]|nr:hypothetical protein CJI59_04255 [Streptomyces sp. Alain-F2R5]
MRNRGFRPGGCLHLPFSVGAEVMVLAGLRHFLMPIDWISGSRCQVLPQWEAGTAHSRPRLRETYKHNMRPSVVQPSSLRA